jgi:hypothetical protein
MIWRAARRCTIARPGTIVGDGSSTAVYVDDRVRLIPSDVVRNHESARAGDVVRKVEDRRDPYHGGGLFTRRPVLSRIEAEELSILRGGSPDGSGTLSAVACRTF